MARICYGLFDSTDQARPALEELTRHGDAHPAFAVQVHERALNPQDLPDCGTEVARNNLIAAAGGGLIGLVGGALAGGLLDVMGLTFVSGAGVGLVSGVLIGILSGMMSGARSAKKALRDLAPEIARGRVLVTVAVEEHGHLRLVEDALSRVGGRRVGNA
jgi:hypothetical protein